MSIANPLSGYTAGRLLDPSTKWIPLPSADEFEASRERESIVVETKIDEPSQESADYASVLRATIENQIPDDSEPATPELSATSSSVLLRDFPELRKPLIDGVLRMTETCNAIAAAKVGKTHLALDLAMSVVTGRAWLNRFPVLNPGPVLYVDAELHPNTMSRRIAAVCSARSIYTDEIAGKLDVLSLRGRLRDIFQLAPWFAKHAAGKYHLIVLDALYRLIPEGIDENSNSDMTRVFNVVDQIAELTGAAVLVIHHASKGVQAGKSVVDVGSGASAMARATDTHLIFRQHESDGCIVLDMAARSWPPLAPVGLRWSYPVWNIDDTLDPEALRQEGRRKRRDEAAEATPEPQIKWTPAMFVETFLTAQAVDKKQITAKAEMAEIGVRKIEGFINLALADRLAYRWHFPKDRGVYLANREQPVTETVKGATI